MSTLLYRVSVTDPLTFAAGPVLFVFIAAVASYLPARRATRVNPVIALR
jgi:ABC-type antimicrobial peptide transport system permease subunit